MLQVPISNAAGAGRLELQATLDGATYTLALRWNVRGAAWFMDVLDEEGATVLVAGLRVVVDYPVGLHRAHRSPPGVFFFEDTTGAGVDPAFADLGVRVRLLYVTAAELRLG